MQHNDFDQIRPYRDEEVPQVIERIISQQGPEFFKYSAHAFPGLTEEAVVENVGKIAKISDFQQMVVFPSVKMCMDHSTDGLSYSGFDQIDSDKPYMFIANHRDIVLDPCVLNYILFQEQLPCTEIAIGNNLLATKLLEDIVKLNDNFIVNRDVPPRQLYEYSNLLSAYISDTLIERQKSVWIAQREGRAKDGNDQTQPALLKMFLLSSSEGFAEHLEKLNIIPVAASYEYNPCDLMMAQEIKTRRETGTYEKKPGEDQMSVETGIGGYKGRVHFQVGRPLNEQLQEVRDIRNKNAQVRKVAELIDRQIHLNYRLWPSNWVAYDLLHDKDSITKYTKEDRMRFMQYLGSRIMMAEGDKQDLRQILLEMYAKPVENYLKSR